MKTAFLLTVLSGLLAATPTLRLSNPVVGPVDVLVGGRAQSNTLTSETYFASTTRLAPGPSGAVAPESRQRTRAATASAAR